jgi:TonB family protein
MPSGYRQPYLSTVVAIMMIASLFVSGCAEPSWVDSESAQSQSATSVGTITLIPGLLPVDRPPSFLREVKASYPRLAISAGVEGVVEVELFVDKDGSTDDVTMTRGSNVKAGLDESAASAAKESTFTPAVRGGRSVRAKIRITYVFSLP